MENRRGTGKVKTVRGSNRRVYLLSIFSALWGMRPRRIPIDDTPHIYLLRRV
jgi:hypothetical protein